MNSKPVSRPYGMQYVNDGHHIVVSDEGIFIDGRRWHKNTLTIKHKDGTATTYVVPNNNAGPTISA